MSRTRTTLSSPLFWVSLRARRTSSANAKLRNWSITEGINSDQFVSSFLTRIPPKPISHFLCKSILPGNFTVTTLPTTSILGSLQNPYFLTHRLISSSSNEQSFTVSYLINSIGLSPETALRVSKHIDLKNPEKADKLINLFKRHGFTEIQISSLVRRNPRLLLVDAEKIILPKLEFLEAKGISGPEMAKKLSTFPTFLTASLAKRIMPSYDFYRTLFQSDEKLILAVKRYPDILVQSIEKFMSPKIDILRRHGVPDSKIATLILNWPFSFSVSCAQFQKIVEKVVDMGFDASKVHFVVAVVVFRSEPKWQSKVDVYKKWGWSEADVLVAFKKCPWCMALSDDKIIACMDFFVNKMGLRSCLIVKHPLLLTLSLKKRIIPRFSVFQVLLPKGLVKESIFSQLFRASEMKFLQKFVMPYVEEAPELMNLYKGKVCCFRGIKD